MEIGKDIQLGAMDVTKWHFHQTREDFEERNRLLGRELSWLDYRATNCQECKIRKECKYCNKNERYPVESNYRGAAGKCPNLYCKKLKGNFKIEIYTCSEHIISSDDLDMAIYDAVYAKQNQTLSRLDLIDERGNRLSYTLDEVLDIVNRINAKKEMEKKGVITK